MDPIRGNHTGLNGLIQSYLKEEWRGRVPEMSEDICSRFDNLRFISLE
nr:probable ubiquitin-like-specific protease 2B [Tanacetum cinerariifolium]